jgi:hypothetical protein
MLGLYSREELTRDEVTELIRREFLARLFEDETEREDDEGENDVEEMVSGILKHLIGIRCILTPKAELLNHTDAEHLFYKSYCEGYTKKTGKEVPDGSGWWPDFLPDDCMYTKGIITHLAQLNVLYDIQWHREMAKWMRQYEAEKKAGDPDGICKQWTSPV